jgi:hypothetical protein
VAIFLSGTAHHHANLARRRCTNNLADLMHRTGRSDEAMATLELAAALFAEIGGDVGEMEPEVWMPVEG